MSDSESQDDTEACSESVDDLLAGLDQFDLTFLKPLLEKPLSETMSSLGGEIEKSKLLVNIGYVLLNLIWIYLRTKGIDPDSHPVIPELERIKSYFSKVKHAENPEKRKFEVDRVAASRFIKSALQANNAKPTEATEPMEIGMQTRFNVLKHQEAALRAEPTKEDVEVNAEGKQSKRPRIDPFAGYDSAVPAPIETSTPPATDTSSSSASSSSRSSKLSKRRKKA